MEKERINDEEHTYASLVAPSAYTFNDLPQSEFYHFLLKCTDGLFKGKFFYINTSAEGEVIGGGDYNNLTLHIEKANLADKHCSIKFTQQFKYVLNDLGSTDGTWVKIFDLNLSTESRDRVYRVSDYEFVICDMNPDEVPRKKSLSKTEDSKSGGKHRNLENVKPLKMVIRKRSDKSNQKVIELTGEKLVFGSSSRADIHLKGDKIADFHFDIKYVNDSFLLRNLNHNISESYGVYKQLFQDENYIIRPGHGIRVGDLEFHVERFNTGIVSDKGGRPYLEDCYAWIHDLYLNDDFCSTYYAIFDGHGGEECAEFLRDNFHYYLRKELLTEMENMTTDNVSDAVNKSFKNAWKITDNKFKEVLKDRANKCGATAVIVLIIADRLFWANIGDARGVLCREGKAINLSKDHKVNREDEQARIKNDGGYIVFGRVLGRLAITRAFGDFECKDLEVQNKDTGETEIKSFIICEPEVREIKIDPREDEFIVLASDGLFDRYSSQEVVESVSEKLSKYQAYEKNPQKVAHELLEETFEKGIGSDNVTILIATLGILF